MPRTFLAIDLPEPVRQALQHARPQRAVGVRPVRENQLHLTLHFLGEVHNDQLPVLLDAMKAIQFAAFELTIAGIGRFPPRGQATVVWAGLTTSDALQSLHQQIGTALLNAGFRVERRRYRPHVTLARLTPETPPEVVDRFLIAQAGLALPDVPVNQFTVYESRKTPNGSEHVSLARVPAAGSGPLESP